MTTLAQAIINRNILAVRQYANSGGELNQYDEFGFTPLIETAIVNDVNLTKLLIDNGADVNMKDMIGGTALHWAVENNNLEMAKLLLRNGADSNAYNNNGEPVLVKPILRKHSELKLLLYEYDASARFAMDFLNVKLLGHRYDLRGSADIVSSEGDFVEVSFEGFFLEFSLNLVRYSLEQYTQNYASRKLLHYFPALSMCIDALRNAGQLIKYQQYQTNLSQHQSVIDALLDRELLIIPVNYEGHAITYILFRDILIKCDRRKIDNAVNGINFFKIRKPDQLTKSLIKRLIYEKKDEKYVSEHLVKNLGLELKTRLMITPQVSGNCSWSNVVACVPAIVYLFTDGADLDSVDRIIDHGHPSIAMYEHWRNWDRLRALQYFMQDFDAQSRKRKASIASLLGAVMFQRFSCKDHDNVETAKRMLKILKTPKYEYVLNNYLDYYYRTKRTPQGENLMRLIEVCESYI